MKNNKLILLIITIGVFGVFSIFTDVFFGVNTYFSMVFSAIAFYLYGLWHITKKSKKKNG